MLWEPLAGLAQVADTRGDTSQASQLASKALTILDETARPAAVYLPEYARNLCVFIQNKIANIPSKND